MNLYCLECQSLQKSKMWKEKYIDGKINCCCYCCYNCYCCCVHCSFKKFETVDKEELSALLKVLIIYRNYW